MSDAPIMMPDMCQKHQYLLVHQAGYKRTDPWQALIIMSNIALFQAATTDDRLYKKMGGDVRKITTLGCLACQKPDAFGEIVEAAKSNEVGAIKALGEKWVNAWNERHGKDPSDV